MKKRKLLKKILNNQRNVKFLEIKLLLESMGFKLDRINGSHQIFVNKSINEIINIQDIGGMVKSYQVKQFLKLIEKYNLKLED